MITSTEIFTVTKVTKGRIEFTDPTTFVPIEYLPDAKTGDIVRVTINAETNEIVRVERL